MEQYLNQVILPRYLHNWLMEALNVVKEQKNAGQLKKVHELIDRVEKSGKKLALYEKVFLELMVTDYKYIVDHHSNFATKRREFYIEALTVFLTKSEAKQKLNKMEKNF